jgi:hypothetical protein
MLKPVKSQRRPKVGAVPWNGLHAEARERFGIDHFRPGQREALEAILCGHSVVSRSATPSVIDALATVWCSMPTTTI